MSPCGLGVTAKYAGFLPVPSLLVGLRSTAPTWASEAKLKPSACCRGACRHGQRLPLRSLRLALLPGTLHGMGSHVGLPLGGLALQEDSAEGQAAVAQEVQQLGAVAQGQHCRQGEGAGEAGLGLGSHGAARTTQCCLKHGDGCARIAEKAALTINRQKQSERACCTPSRPDECQAAPPGDNFPRTAWRCVAALDQHAARAEHQRQLEVLPVGVVEVDVGCRLGVLDGKMRTNGGDEVAALEALGVESIGGGWHNDPAASNSAAAPLASIPGERRPPPSRMRDTSGEASSVSSSLALPATLVAAEGLVGRADASAGVVGAGSWPAELSGLKQLTVVLSQLQWMLPAAGGA